MRFKNGVNADLAGNSEQEVNNRITMLLVNRLVYISWRLEHLQDRNVWNNN